MLYLKTSSLRKGQGGVATLMITSRSTGIPVTINKKQYCVRLLGGLKVATKGPFR